MFKLKIGIAIFLATPFLLTATVSAQTGSLEYLSQGINSFNGLKNWNGVSGYIYYQARVDFNNAYSGGPGDPPNTFSIYGKLFDQSDTQFQSGLMGQVVLDWNDHEEVQGQSTYPIATLNSYGITSVRGEISGYLNFSTVLVSESNAFGWHN